MEKTTNWNYDALARELSENHDCDEAAIPFLLEEARKRRDGGVIAELADWFDEGKDHRRFLELATEAAELGSPRANFWLGHEYLSGKDVPRDYEKAYACFLKGQEVDWVPIEPEENTEYEIDGDVEVTADMLLSDSDGDIGWWLFVLEKHPTRSLKCGMADWFMKQGGDENRKRALKLLEESANDGFEFAFLKLLEFYSSGDFKDIEKGRHWFYKAEEHGFDEACFADALGVESLECRKLKAAADLGDRKAAAKLACAYLHGGYGDYICCAKDEALARQYGVLASLDEDGMDELIAGLDVNSVQDGKFLSDLSKK